MTKIKAILYDVKGTKKGEIEMPEVFSTKIRKDIAAKYFEATKFTYKHPYTHDPEAGRKHSASGTISHKRHDWKWHYGKGISRVPRKTMWRRGTQFYWVGAEVSGARGGRRVHCPKGIGRERKLNKKEIKIALNSGFAATVSKEHLLSRYSSLTEIKNIPAVIEALPKKTRELKSTLKEV